MVVLLGMQGLPVDLATSKPWDTFHSDELKILQAAIPKVVTWNLDFLNNTLLEFACSMPFRKNGGFDGDLLWYKINKYIYIYTLPETNIAHENPHVSL